MKVSSHPGTNQKMLLAQDWPCSYLKAITLEKELAFYSEIWARDILQVHDRLAKKKKKSTQILCKESTFLSVCLSSFASLIAGWLSRVPPATPRRVSNYSYIKSKSCLSKMVPGLERNALPKTRSEPNPSLVTNAKPLHRRILQVKRLIDRQGARPWSNIHWTTFSQRKQLFYFL